ncbi:efflux RND transporter permease subunit [uncultured Friedmanniella sp.]|uniref:efflux RND transporter permease subunit n=1 Tax=uncultured Friedmanniella sp. TaxID=335381 RepID=UPI0035C9B01F
MTSLTRLSLANRLIVGLVALAILVFGVLSTTSLRQELLPSTQVPSATVTAVYPGTAPELVAEEVAKPLGQALDGVSGVTKVSSLSTNGVANLTVEWTYGLDSDQVVDDLRSAADGLAGELPDDVDVTVTAGSTDDIPVLVLAVASDDPLAGLARKVNDIAVPQLSGVEGVRSVQVAGQDVAQLVVTLKPEQLRTYDLSAAAVTQAVQAQALVVPAGNSYRGDNELAIQVGQTPTAAKQVAAWPIPAPDGAVELGRLATVAVESVEATSLARSDGRPALSINVLKESDADAVDVSHTIRDLLPGLTPTLGTAATASVVFDQAPSIEQSIHDLAIEGGLGLAFAVLIILVFLLSLRSTLITALSIPLSLLVALTGLKLGDYSLNIFTLAALTVAVGRVVDDSIVVIENIKRRALSVAVLTPADIVASVREVAGAVTASTLTTVAVFLPVALVSGITGELFKPFSITVAIALVASLLVSMTIVPVLAYWLMRGGRRGAVAGRAADEEDRITRLQRGYLPLLRGALRRPLLTVLAAVLVFAGTMASATLLKTDFLASFADKTTLQVDQELPVGTRLSTTSAAAKKVERVLSASPGVKEYLTTVGQGGTNRASMFVSLTGEDAYAATKAELESGFAELSDAGTVKLGSINTGTNNDLSFVVTGDDAGDLRTTATRVEDLLTATPGLTDVSSDLTAQRPLLRVQVNRTKAADLGFTSSEVGQLIAGDLTGTKVGSVVLQGETRDIVVRPQDAQQASPKQIARLELPVSQLQQQQATDRATDRLKKKQDRLKAEGEDLKDASDELSDRQEALAADQKAAGEVQQDEANQAAADQRADLRKSRARAQKALAASRKQLRTLRRNAPPAPAQSAPAPPAPGQPADPGQVPVTQAQQRYLQYQQRVAQLAAGVAQAEASVKQLDAQVDAGNDQATKSADQQAQSEEFSRRQDELTAEQKKLGKQQTDLTDRQSDLADDQADIADVRARAIRVSDIATVKETLAPSTVTEIDGTRAVTLTATPQTDDLGALTTQVQQRIDALTDVPPGVSITVGGASDDQAEAFRQLGLAMLAAIAIVFLIMVATFRSLVQPLVLLTSIPFAATGAVLGLLVTDTALGVPAMVGLLMLIGIVVTNAIVLIDLINQRRAQGEDLQAAIVHGARLRLRPIIMTATATICALIPMGLGLTGGGAFIGQPLAVVVIGGLVTSTVLTLLLVPVLYSLVERRSERRRLRAAEQAH